MTRFPYQEKRAAVAHAELDAQWGICEEMCRDAGTTLGERTGDAEKDRTQMMKIARRMRGKVSPANVFQASMCGIEFADPGPARTPTSAPAGSQAKIEVMCRRVERGQGCFHPEDGGVCDGAEVSQG